MEWAKGINLNPKVITYKNLDDIEYQDFGEDLAADSWIIIDPDTNKPIKNADAEFLVYSWKTEVKNRKRRHSGIFLVFTK